jgi:serine/threonine protein kinase/tetratricopeptide (TPR) repeat protein
MTRNGTLPTSPASLDDLVDSLAERLQAGDPSAVEAFLADHPEHADELRRMLPAMRVLGGMDLSTRNVGEKEYDLVVLGELGDYLLVREIGRGGMGVVYEAIQLSLNRRVALKVLPFAATMDPRQLQRFKLEAQAAAMLHHPHIVPVHGIGCKRGVHYYAMQLIEGRSLAAIIEELQPKCDRPADATADYTSTPSQSATTKSVAVFSTQKSKSKKDKGYFRTTVERIAQAADALEYAHSMGVVHRDVKPANLLLDEVGHLWVTDFGLAKLDSAAGMTVSGDLIGTLRYMSPEQALARHGLVDHRTDVYSLGATLYELLSLRPVFDGKDKHELLKQIAFEEPRALRKFDRSIPTELETITLKALSKNPEERYTSAGVFAEDLRRWLGHHTIKAKPPSMRLRCAKWVRRYPSFVSACLAIAVIISIASGYLVISSMENNANLTKAYSSEKIAKQAASARLLQTQQILGDITSTVIADWLLQSEIGIKERAFADRLVGHFDRMALVVDDDMDAQVFLADAYGKIAAIRNLQGDNKGSIELIEKSRTLRKSLMVNHASTDSYLINYVKKSSELAEMLTNDIQERTHAESLHREAVGIAFQFFQRSQNIDSYDLPRIYDYYDLLWLTRSNYARFLERTGRTLEALELRRSIVDSKKEWLDKCMKTNREDKNYLVKAYIMYGASLSDIESNEEAVNANRQAISLMNSLPPDKMQPGNILYANLNLGGELFNQGKYEEALECQMKAESIEISSLKKYEKKFGEENASFGFMLLCYEISKTLSALGRNEEALAKCLEGLEHARERYEETPGDVISMSLLAECQYHYGNQLARMGRIEEALKQTRSAVDNYDKVVSKRGTTIGSKYASGTLAHFALAEMLYYSGQREDAGAEYINAMRMAEKAKDRNHVCATQYALIMARADDERHRNIKRSLEVSRQAAIMDPRDKRVLSTYGYTLYYANDYQEAIHQLEQSIRGYPQFDTDYFILAMAYWQTDNKEKAREWYDKGVAWGEKSCPGSVPFRELRRTAAEKLGIPLAADQKRKQPQ